ncbi:TetR/AcrR family transcriptional regulator [Streptococcus himalayensis]|uniref:Transcription regulator n=1 Tax=Streptococcus himalayensis TaxID=1888195 RepID=A0A917AAJ4_9STRE|nr:TetR/AcrR family transcriptional regulator [Streptococcus himalayensis]GGE38284.1 putative transcription regulator [Streptococcus himalayensis]
MDKQRLNILKQNNDQSRKITRESLTTALLLLLNEKDFSQISITELCQKAGVSRTAFYRNYKTKDEVLDDQIMTYINELRQCVTEDLYKNWLQAFLFVEKHRKELEVIVQAGLEHRIFLALSVRLPTDPRMRTVQILWDSIAYALIIEWVIHKTPESAEEMANIAYEETKALSSYFR